MHKKAIGLISLLCLLTLGHSLMNDFVGDDHTFLLENNFYRTQSNITHLISPQYITDSDDVFNRNETALVSGSVAYRPVLSLTYFFDSWVWGVNPLGFHLTNLLLHWMNSFLVYFCLLSLFQRYFKNKEAQAEEISLLAAIIFCIHPLRTEAVCSIGYRADLLASFFVLFSFLVYLHLRFQKGWRKVVQGIVCHVLFFLGLFSKEAVIIYPCILLALDWSAQRFSFKKSFLRIFARYAGFVGIVGFYVFVYCFLLPNSAMNHLRWLGGSFLNHVMTIIFSLSQYLLAIVLPHTVRMIPPRYVPPVESLWGAQTGIFIAIVSLFACLCLVLTKKRNWVSFFCLWFVLSLIPVINLVPLPNPFAYRFMYFPSFGASALLAIFFYKNRFALSSRRLQRSLAGLVRLGYVVLCVIVTFFSVFAWQNNFIAAKNMIQDFPRSPIGHLMLSIEYQRNRMLIEAKESAQKSLSLGIQDPRAYHVLGICHERDYGKAKEYYQRCSVDYPRYAACFIGQGKMTFFQGDYERAQFYLRKGIDLSPSLTGYLYLIQVALLKGELVRADEIYQEAKRIFSEEHRVNILNQVYRLYNQKMLPYDYGY